MSVTASSPLPGLADHIDVRLPFEVQPHTLARQRLVVHDDGAYAILHGRPRLGQDRAIAGAVSGVALRRAPAARL
jgi:hypothetical protein